jgi:hypothetical protein
MGYKLGPSEELLDFVSGTALHGLKVKVNGDVSLSTFFDLQIWLSSGEAAQMREAFVLFGNDILVSWDLEDDDGQVEADGDGVLSLPMSLAMGILEAWSDQMGSAKKAQGASQNGISQSVGELIETGT